MRQPAVLFCLMLILFGVLRQTRLTTYLSSNIGAVALNIAYEQPERFASQLRLAQTTLARKADRGGEQEASWAQVGLAFLLQHKTAEAEDAWRRSTLSEESLLQYAAHARELGFPQTALEICDLVIANSPAYRDPWYLKAEIWASRGEYETALAAFQNGLDSTEYGRYGESDFYFRMGEIYHLFLPETALTTAQMMYRQAIEKNNFRSETDLIRALYLNGEAYRITGNLPVAMAEFEQVLSLNPNHYWANIRLGQLLWRETETLADAEGFLLRAIASNEQEKGAYKVLGAIYLENGRFLDAQTMYETVLKLDPTDAQALQAIETIQTNAP